MLISESIIKCLIAYQDSELKSTDTFARYAAYFRNLGRIARYLAFTSDVGEAIRPVVGRRIVQGCYGVSWLYVIGDVSYEGNKVN